MNIHINGFWFLQGFMFLQLAYIILQWRIFHLKDYKYYLLYLLCINFVMGLSFLMHHYEANQKSLLLKLEFYLFNMAAYGINIFYNFLSIHLLNLKERNPKLYRQIKRFTGFLLMQLGVEIILLMLGFDFKTRTIVLFFFILFNYVISIWLIVRLFRMNITMVSFYAIGSISLALGSFTNNMLIALKVPDLFGILPIFYTLIGMFIECICFNLILNYKYILIEEEKQLAQQQLIEQLKESQQLYIEKQDIRNNIAKDLHDEIGSALTSINILSNVSRATIQKDPVKTNQLLNQISDQSETVQQTMSDIVWAIKADNDSLENMATRMREYVSQTLEIKQIATRLHFDETIFSTSLPMEVRKDFLLIFKEAVNNVVKHANASEVVINLIKEKGNVELTISDNGVGIHNSSKHSGNGLANMKTRANQISGNLYITSGPDKGTILRLVMPIP